MLNYTQYSYDVNLFILKKDMCKKLCVNPIFSNKSHGYNERNKMNERVCNTKIKH